MPPDMDAVRRAFAEQDYLLSEHASDRALERDIGSTDIEQAARRGEVIEDYPDDKYGPSCLLMGTTDAERVLHIHIGYARTIKVITVYDPDPDKWEADWKTRKTP